MKKQIILAFLFVLGIVNAQSKDVTKFLGIPVDGTKGEMISKLRAKGFTGSSYDRNILQGEFNGRDVNVHVVTNNRKVYRIMVSDANPVGESEIKIRFNNLCNQFENNEKYTSMSLSDDNVQTIPADENISYNMIVNKKRYEAVFYQKPESLDSLAIKKEVQAKILSKYTPEQLENPTEEIQSDIIRQSFLISMELIAKKAVWFMISEFSGKYYITMFYDNVYNQANGEDL